MVGFRWIQIYVLVLQITEPVAVQRFLSVTVRDGDEVTLPCNSVIDGSKNCDSTEWIFTNLRIRATVVLLVRDGQIHEEAKDKSDRLSVSEKCSLIIKNVKDEDGARYECRQFRSGQQHGPDAVVLLYVVTMTEHEDDDEVTLRCSVSTYGGCGHTVKWLLQGQHVDKDNKDLKTSQSSCSASLTFLTSHFIYTSRFKSLKCEVTRGDTVQQFSFKNSPSGDKTGEDTITTPTEDDTKGSKNQDGDGQNTDWWLYVSVALGLAALLIIVVTVVRCIKTRANQTRVDDNIAVPEGVSYASIRHTGKTNSKARVRGGEDAVTYSTVNHPSADDNNLYATVN